MAVTSTGPYRKQSAPHSRQITTPTPHHSVFYMPDSLPDAEPTVSHIIYIYHFSVCHCLYYITLCCYVCSRVTAIPKPVISCRVKILNGFAFLLPAYLGCPGKEAINTDTHTCLTALCPGLPGWAGTRKVKTIWILLKQETVSGSGISWAICKSAKEAIKRMFYLLAYWCCWHRCFELRSGSGGSGWRWLQRDWIGRT